MMKQCLLIMFVLIPLLACAQRTFKFTVINAQTNKPYGRKWGTVIKNSYTYIDFNRSDTNGVFTFTDRSYDTTATYEVEFLNQWNNKVEPGLHNITAVKTLPDVSVRLTPASVGMPYGCGEVMYPSYHPRTPYTITDLSTFIQRKIKSYFFSRVGPAFSKKLVLNGGQIVDLKLLYKLNPKIKANGWIPPAYSLCFMVWDSVKHTTAYNFTVEMDETGKLLKELQLPDIRHHAEKAIIMCKDEAIAIGKQYDIYNPYTQAKLYYYAKAGSLVWELEMHEPGEGEQVSTKILIDAHNGNIVDRLTSKIEVMY